MYICTYICINLYTRECKVLISNCFNNFETFNDNPASFDIKKIKPRISSLIILLTLPLMQSIPSHARLTPSQYPPPPSSPLYQVIRVNSVDPNS